MYEHSRGTCLIKPVGVEVAYSRVNCCHEDLFREIFVIGPQGGPWIGGKWGPLGPLGPNPKGPGPLGPLGPGPLGPLGPNPKGPGPLGPLGPNPKGPGPLGPLGPGPLGPLGGSLGRSSLNGWPGSLKVWPSRRYGASRSYVTSGSLSWPRGRRRGFCWYYSSCWVRL